MDICVGDADVRRRPAKGSGNGGELGVKADEVTSAVDLLGESGCEGKPVLGVAGEIRTETRTHQRRRMMGMLKWIMETAETDGCEGLGEWRYG